MAVTKVVMPKLSEAMESGKIIKWLKKEGDRIQGGDILAEVETDKADREMEASGGGFLRKILAPAGETVPVGTLIGVIAEPGDDVAALIASAPAPAPARAGAPALAVAAPSTPAPTPAASPRPPAVAPAPIRPSPLSSAPAAAVAAQPSCGLGMYQPMATQDASE